MDNKETLTEPTTVEEAKVEEVMPIIPEEIPVHLKQGKTHFEVSHYKEALREFESILRVAPGNIEVRVWLRRTREELAEPAIEQVTDEKAAAVTTEVVKPKECLWMKMGMVSYRICTNNYNCVTCEFDQVMQEKMARTEAPELDAMLETFKELPGNQRLCRYALGNYVSHRLCTRLFQCASCEFGQMMEDALEQKLAKLTTRREALSKRAS